MSMIGKVSWQKPGLSTCPSRGAPLIIVWGVESRVHFSMGSKDTGAWRTNAIYRHSRFLRHNLADAETGLGKARARWHLTSLRSAIACTPPPWQVWGGLGNSANVLDVKACWSTPLNLL